MPARLFVGNEGMQLFIHGYDGGPFQGKGQPVIDSNSNTPQLLPSDPLISQIEVIYPLKRSLKKSQKGHEPKNVGVIAL